MYELMLSFVSLLMILCWVIAVISIFQLLFDCYNVWDVIYYIIQSVFFILLTINLIYWIRYLIT